MSRSSAKTVVVAISGAIGSGKTSVARALSKKLELPVASFGDYVRNVAKSRRQDISRTTLQEISEELLSSVGPQNFVRNVLADSSWNRLSPLVVDGLRHEQVLMALRKEVEPIPVLLVYLEATSSLRHERVAARDKGADSNLQEFELHSTEKEVATRIRSLASVILDSSTSEETLVEAILSEMRRLE